MSKRAKKTQPVPEGLVPIRKVHRFVELGVRTVFVTGHGSCVPTWAHRIDCWRLFKGKSQYQTDAMIRKLASSGEDAQAAAMTVLDLGGYSALIEYVLGLGESHARLEKLMRGKQATK